MPTPVAPETALVHSAPPTFSTPNGTHRSTPMAFSSGSITYIDYTTYIDYATDTFAELSIPTSPHSTSTAD